MLSKILLLFYLPDQNRLSNPDYGPTCSTKFIKDPNRVTVISSNWQFLWGYTASKTKLSALFGLSLIASCLMLIVSKVLTLFFL